MQGLRLARCHPLYLVIVVVVGLTAFNSVLYEPNYNYKGGLPIMGFTGFRPKSATDLSVAWKTLRQDEAGEKDPCEDYNANRLVQGVLDGPFLCPGSNGYMKTIKVFNTALQIKPKVVIRPQTEEDVSAAVKLAQKYGLIVTVKNGGHNPAGFSLHQGGMVIDMKLMKRVSWAKEQGDVLSSQGGARWSDVHAVVEERSRAIVGGGCPQVGVVGLALGGGVGWLSRSRGLVSDNLLAARIVFPNGTLATVNSQNNPELLWALRGSGGSNFGVITEVLLKTFPAEKEYFAGSFCMDRHPDSLRDILVILQKMINGEFDLDKRLTMDMFMSRLPPTPENNHPEKVSLCWAAMFDGPIPEAISTSRELLANLAELIMEQDVCRSPKHSCKTESSTRLALAQGKAWVKQGGPWLQGHTFKSWSRSFGVDYLDVHWRSFMSETFTDGMVDRTVALFRDLPEYRNKLGVNMVVQIAFEHLGGQMQENSKQVSAWKHGNAKVMGSIQSYIVDPFGFQDRFSPDHQASLGYLKNWTTSMYSAMLPHSQGSYSNYADGELKDWAERYFGDGIYSRLQMIKKSIPGAYEMFAGTQRIDLHDRAGVQQSLEGPAVPREPQSRTIPSGHVSISNGDEGFKIKNEHDVIPLTMNTSVISFTYAYSRSCPESISQTVVPVSASTTEVWNDDVNSINLKADGATVSERIETATARKLVETISRNDILKERNILLTGGSRGIGQSAVLHLLNLGASVVYTSQSQTGCKTSLQKMQALVESRRMSGKVACQPLVLNDFGSVGSFINRVQSNIFDTVILNAGSFDPIFKLEPRAGNSSKALAANHLGHFLLVHKLLEANMISTEFGRIIVASSFGAQRAMPSDIKELLAIPPVPYNTLKQDEPIFKSDALRMYAAAKAISIFFAVELAARLKSEGKRIAVAVPVSAGTAHTTLTDIIFSSPEHLKSVLGNSPPISTQEAALASVYLSSHLARDLESNCLEQGKAAIVSGCTTVEDQFFHLDDQDLRCLVWNVSLVMTSLDSQPIPAGSVARGLSRPC